MQKTIFFNYKDIPKRVYHLSPKGDNITLNAVKTAITDLSASIFFGLTYRYINLQIILH